MVVSLGIVYLYVGWATFGIVYKRHSWIDESLVWRYAKLAVTLKKLVVQLGVYMYGITFNKHACSLKVALALDALYFGKQCGKGSTKLLIIGYLYISLAFKLYKPYSRRIVVECPTCNKRTLWFQEHNHRQSNTRLQSGCTRQRIC